MVLGFQVEPRIKEGPKRDLEGYLKSVDRLNEAVVFFSQNRQFKSSDAALQHAKDLLRESLLRLEEDFRTLITANRYAPSSFLTRCLQC
jgi:exocyst complex protein 7